MHKPMFIMGFPELGVETKWKLFGDHALAVWRFDLAWESFKKFNNLSVLMLLLSSTGVTARLRKLAVSVGV